MPSDIADGVYTLLFRLPADPNATACGLAIVRDNRIIGSDPEGGVFEGVLALDTETGQPLIQGTMSVPPAGELITGLSAGPEGMNLKLTAHPQSQDGTLHFVTTIAGETIAVAATFSGPLPHATCKRRTARPA